MSNKKLIIKLDVIQSKKIIAYTFILSIIFGALFFYVKEKTKFNFKEGIFIENIKNNIDLISDYKNNLRNKNIKNIEPNTLSLEKGNKIKKELEYKKIKSKILAKSYLVLDIENKKILISEKENEKLPLASISKLMTAYTALIYCNDNLKLELDKILIASDNESADYLANNCPNYDEFIKNMNYLSQKNNLNMTFINSSGLDINDETDASNYGTASSVAKLINLVYEKNPSILSHTTKSNYLGIKNTNESVIKTPFLIGSKTGFTDMAGGNLVTIYEVGPGSRFAIVVLGSTKEDRFTDTEILLNYFLKSK